MRILTALRALTLCVLFAVPLVAEPHRRALLIGINDYSASGLPRRPGYVPVPGRDWPSLGGAVNDVQLMREMLVRRRHFDRRDIVVLTDQQATRDAILQAIDAQLVQPAERGDIVLFYYSGHGAQVRNSLSDERDGLDESIVPADGPLGAPDIRDKELRRKFNAILNRGARLTIVLDSCHSGSGARGLETGARPKGLSIDSRDVADGRDAGPRPEDRGALVVSAAEDREVAWETRDDEGRFHGAFSWAWSRAIRDAADDESALEIFLRAQARLRAETPFQSPGLAGSAEVRRQPFAGNAGDRILKRASLAVEQIRDDGTVVLQGGWADGLTVGSELRPVQGGGRLIVSAVLGVGESEARVDPGASIDRSALRPGMLVEVTAWAMPRTPPLHVWIPENATSAGKLALLAKTLRGAAARRHIRWISDPLEAQASYLLRWNGGQWELLNSSRIIAAFAPSAAEQAIDAVRSRSTLFVDFPSPAGVVANIGLADGADTSIHRVQAPTDADYLLVGRFHGGRLEYAWVRPTVTKTGRRRSGLPERSEWHPLRNGRLSSASLRSDLETLRKIFAWQSLASPPGQRAPYHLALRRMSNGQLVHDGLTFGGEHYRLELQIAPHETWSSLRPRYVYIFTIDHSGRSVLLFPRDGASVENRFPLPPDPTRPPAPPPAEIPLDETAQFHVSEPFGVDTYFLFISDQRLPNPAIFEWDGLQQREKSDSALEELIARTTSGERGTTPIVPSGWFIEKMVCESRPAGRSK